MPTLSGASRSPRAARREPLSTPPPGAFEGWRRTPISKRAAVLNRAADHLEVRADQIAREMTREMGKSLGLARDEVVPSAQTLRFYAVEGQSLTGEVFPNDDADMTVYTLREHARRGVDRSHPGISLRKNSILARKIAPALVTGNTVVFKPLVGCAAQRLSAGGSADHGGAARRACSTSSPARPARSSPPSPSRRRSARSPSRDRPPPANRSAARSASSPARRWSSVAESADRDGRCRSRPGRSIWPSRAALSLAGQACTGTSRVLVMKQVRSEFTRPAARSREKRSRSAAASTGGTDMGPLATARQLETVLRYVAIGKTEATHLYGGDRLTGARLSMADTSFHPRSSPT